MLRERDMMDQSICESCVHAFVTDFVAIVQMLRIMLHRNVYLLVILVHGLINCLTSLCRFI